MKKIFLGLILASFLVTFSSSAQAAKSWELVYDQAADGTTVSGSVTALISAIQAGGEVLIVAHSPAEESIKPQSVRLLVNGTVVEARFSQNYWNLDKTDVNPMVGIYKTDATREVIWPKSGNANNISSIGMSWYVNR